MFNFPNLNLAISVYNILIIIVPKHFCFENRLAIFVWCEKKNAPANFPKMRKYTYLISVNLNSNDVFCYKNINIDS